jgi:uncharacterized protein
MIGYMERPAEAGVQVGVVTRLWRYLVKSMAGQEMASADVSWFGLAGDRRWAFVRPASDSDGFPWHTIRENPAMSRYVPWQLEPEHLDKSAIAVRTPDGGSFDLADPHLAQELGAGVRLMRLYRGTFDVMPISLITTSTVAELCRLAGVADDELRFRPNILITPASGAAYAEDEWAGSTLRIGSAAIRVDRRDSRCTIVNVNPRTGQPDAPMLKVVGRYHEACAGVYGSTVAPGRIQVGDLVTIGP